MTIDMFRGPVRFLTIASFVTTVGSGLYLAGSMLFFTRVVGLSVAGVSSGLAIATVVGILSGLPSVPLPIASGPGDCTSPPKVSRRRRCSCSR